MTGIMGAAAAAEGQGESRATTETEEITAAWRGRAAWKEVVLRGEQMKQVQSQEEDILEERRGEKKLLLKQQTELEVPCGDMCYREQHQ